MKTKETSKTNNKIIKLYYWKCEKIRMFQDIEKKIKSKNMTKSFLNFHFEVERILNKSNSFRVRLVFFFKNEVK